MNRALIAIVVAMVEFLAACGSSTVPGSSPAHQQPASTECDPLAEIQDAIVDLGQDGYD
ncbi:MAG: hypothetical protein ACRDRL_27390 [Sciscionella sp.]